MKTITQIQPVPLAYGIQQILFDIQKKHGAAKYPINLFETLIMSAKEVSKQDAHYVTEKVLETGIISTDSTGLYFTL